MERSSLRFDEAKGPKLLPRFVVYIALAAGLMVADLPLFIDAARACRQSCPCSILFNG